MWSVSDASGGGDAARMIAKVGSAVCDTPYAATDRQYRRRSAPLDARNVEKSDNCEIRTHALSD